VSERTPVPVSVSVQKVPVLMLLPEQAALPERIPELE